MEETGVGACACHRPPLRQFPPFVVFEHYCRQRGPCADVYEMSNDDQQTTRLAPT
jgi:hypothetical protein